MQIKKLDSNVDSISELRNKINEIIDILNTSFITLDPDTTSLDNAITCDTLTPKLNEFVTLGTVHDFAYDNNVEEPRGLFSDVRCPKCGKQSFEVGPSITTCGYYPPVYKDGVNINTDRNKTTTKYKCVCGHTWKETT